jgi:hypothetical protein
MMTGNKRRRGARVGSGISGTMSTLAAVCGAVSALTAMSSARGSTIAQVTATPTGTTGQTITGATITGIRTNSATYGYSFFLQDSTGFDLAYEIPAASFSGFTPALGDVINVGPGENDPYTNATYSYTLNEYATDTADGAPTASLVSTGATLPVGATITGASLLSDASDQKYYDDNVILSSVTFAAANVGQSFTAGTTYTVTDTADSDTVAVYIPTPTPGSQLTGTIPSGPVNIEGIVYPYTSGVELNLFSSSNVTAVPEPASCGLLAAGAAALLFRRRRA